MVVFCVTGELPAAQVLCQLQHDPLYCDECALRAALHSGRLVGASLVLYQSLCSNDDFLYKYYSDLIM